MLESGRKTRFRRVVPSVTTMMELSFGSVVSGSIVLDAMVEKDKPLLDTITCFNQPQSPSTATAKTTPFPQFIDVPRLKRRRKEGSLELATSTPIVLRRIMETNDPLFGAICYPSLLI